MIQLSRAWVIIKTTKTLTQNDVQNFMFIAALFAMAKMWRHTKCLPKYSHAVLPSHKNEEILLFVITGMDAGFIMLSERSQKKTNTV